MINRFEYLMALLAGSIVIASFWGTMLYLMSITL